MRLNTPIQPSSRVFGVSFRVAVRSNPVHRHGMGFEELIMAKLHLSGVGYTFEMFDFSWHLAGRRISRTWWRRSSDMLPLADC